MNLAIPPTPYKKRIACGALGLMGWAIAQTAALANCSTPVGSIDWHEPASSRHFQRLKEKATYAWGSAAIYDRVEDEKIFLTAAFENLSSEHKVQAIDELLDFDAQDYLTPEAYEDKFTPEGMATGIGTSPFEVFASDRRAISTVYDGCTRFLLLTELDRFSWYYNTEGGSTETSAQGDLRNAGQPSWRQINFPIEATAEKAVRLGFWNEIGYPKVYESSGWWIAWVPEHGYFEVNVPQDFEYDRLQRYWQVADRRYDYVVVRTDGKLLGKKQFSE